MPLKIIMEINGIFKITKNSWKQINALKDKFLVNWNRWTAFMSQATMSGVLLIKHYFGYHVGNDNILINVLFWVDWWTYLAKLLKGSTYFYSMRALFVSIFGNNYDYGYVDVRYKLLPAVYTENECQVV